MAEQDNDILSLDNLLSGAEVIEEETGEDLAAEVLNKQENNGIQQQDTEEPGDGSGQEDDSETVDPSEADRSDGDGDDDSTEAEDGDTESGDSGDEGNDGDSEQSIFDYLRERTGYAVEGEFEEDQEGLAAFVSQLAEERANEIVTSTLDSRPVVKEFIEFIDNGGDPAQFMQVTAPTNDWTKVEVTEEDVNGQKNVITSYLNKKGIDEGTINNLITVLETQGNLKTEAEQKLNLLQTEQKQERQQVIEQQRAVAEAEQQKAAQQWKQTVDIVKSGDLNGFNIPERQRDKFIKWFSEPVDKNGNTARMLAANKMTTEQGLQLEYMLFKGFDLKEEISKGAAKKRAKDALSRITKKKTNKMSGGSSDSGASGGAEGHILDIGTIMNS